MNQVLTTMGVKQDPGVVFSDLQTYIQNSFLGLLQGLVSSFGVFAEMDTSGQVLSTDTSLLASYVSNTQSTLTISAGYALTSDFCFINIPQNTSTNLPTVASGTVTTHTLYIDATSTQTAYAPILNGFAYSLTGTTAPTRILDSYSFVWDTPPVTGSGIVLASVTLSGLNSGSYIVNLTDLRYQNLFVLDRAALPNNKLLRLDKTTNQTTIGPITAPNFYVGSAPVLTTGSIPVAPVNFHIYDIIPASEIEHLDNTAPPTLPADTYAGLETTYAAVKLKWGFKITNPAVSIINGVYVTDNMIDDVSVIATGAPAPDHTLSGLHLYIATTNKEYMITDNTYNGTTYQWTLKFQNLDGTTAAGTITSIGGDFIHSDADSFELIAIPYVQGTNTLDYTQKYETKISYSSYDVNNNRISNNNGLIFLPIGQKYLIQIRSVIQFQKSAYIPLTGGVGVSVASRNTNGIYYKTTNTGYYTSSAVSYTIPAVIKFQTLAMGNAAVGAVSSFSGFIVTLNPGSTSTDGWQGATAYEVTWSQTATTVSGLQAFPLSGYQRIVVPNLFAGSQTIEVSTPTKAQYDVFVRPLIGGQIASSGYLATSVTSGAGGGASQGQVIWTGYINLNTYSGNMTAQSTVTATIFSATLGSVVSPAGGSLTAPIDSSWIGSTLTDYANHDYVIQAIGTGGVVYLANFDGSQPAPTIGTFTINTSLAGRQIAQITGFSTEYLFSSIDFYADVVQGGPTKLRVYQINNAPYADIISAIANPGNDYTISADDGLFASRGNLTLMIDAWDPASSGAINTGSIAGQLTIHGFTYSPIAKAPTPQILY